MPAADPAFVWRRDEEALVAGAARMGFRFTKQSHQPARSGDGNVECYTVETPTGEQVYEKHAVNEFSSARKRMSAVFRAPDGQYMVLAKGADMMMAQNCGVEIPREADGHMQNFAVDGLRTLVVGRKELTDDEFREWKAEYDAAKNDIVEREPRLEAAAERVEQGMEYIGVTAIEDKLQEGVPDAIAKLREAGLKVWVLTGDKEETAINIGKSCRLLDATMDLHIIRGSPEGQVDPFSLDEIMDSIKPPAELQGKPLALVVDGKALGELFRGHTPRDGDEKTFSDKQERAQEALVDVGDACVAVIGCRVSPKQKRDIVKLVKDNIEAKRGVAPMTLAIGDGANDVSMIQEAHIGVGISGNEGMQAVRSADYAIGQFRFLKRLMLVHGRWNYRRVCAVILYSFYKGIAFNMTLFCFGFFNGSSGTTLYESWLGSGWNVIWTFLPIIFLGAFDQDVPEDTVLAHPALYRVGQQNFDLNKERMGLFVATAAAHALILFGLVYGSFYLTLTAADGTTDGLYIMGTTLNCCLTITVNLKVVQLTNMMTAWNAFAISSAVAAWFLFVLGYSELFGLSGGDFYGISTQLFPRSTFWLVVVLAPITVRGTDLADNSLRLLLLKECCVVQAMLPDFVLSYLKFNYFPEEWDKKRKESVAKPAGHQPERVPTGIHQPERLRLGVPSRF